MEKQFMHRVSRLLPSSLASSCHFRNVPDVIDSSILITRNSQPKPKTHVSVFPNLTKNSTSSNNSGWFSSEQEEEEEEEEEPLIHHETQTIFSLSSHLSPTSNSSVDPSSLLNSNRKSTQTKLTTSDCTEMGYSPSLVSDASTDFSLKSSARKSHFRRQKSSSSTSSSCSLYYSDFGSFRMREGRPSNDDKVLGCCSFDKRGGGGAAQISGEFSRKNTQKHRSQTTTGVGSFRRKTNRQRRKKKLISDGEVLSSMRNCSSSTHIYYSDSGRRKTKKSSSVSNYGKAGESYAVEKSSRDPYNDFWLSMVEMIVEKEIFREEELAKLLECFLYLNSSQHHDTIIKVFLDICTNLFTH